MKTKLVLAAALAVSPFAGASANETAKQCRAFVAANGGDPSGCDCLGEAAAADPALAAALAAIKTKPDLDAADESTKAAIAACFAGAGEGTAR